MRTIIAVGTLVVVLFGAPRLQAMAPDSGSTFAAVEKAEEEGDRDGGAKRVRTPCPVERVLPTVCQTCSNFQVLFEPTAPAGPFLNLKESRCVILRFQKPKRRLERESPLEPPPTP